MNQKQHFEKHYAKLRWEAILRALICGSIVGLFFGFAVAFSTWFIELINGLWPSVGAIVLVSAIATLLFYFKKFRPTAMRNAKRIDSLGLEERLITMVEYEADESYIAAIQREDAKSKLAALESSKLKIRLPKAKTMILLLIAFLLGAGMTTVTTLSSMGLIKSGSDWFEEIIDSITGEEQIVYVAVTYDVEEGGSIDGESDQLIPLGGSTEMIVAVADDGYEFVEWDDGYKKPARYDKNINEDTVYIAIFMPIDTESQDGEPSDESDQEQDQQEPKESEQENENQQTKPDEEDKESQSNAGGGKYEESNQIIDGETYYKEVLELYRELLKERLETEGAQLTDEERAIIEAYLGIV